MFTKQEIQKIEQLNNTLKKVEEKAYNLAKKQNQDALKNVLEKQDDIYDYVLYVKFDFYIEKYALIHIDENMKFAFLEDKRGGHLNDKIAHNIQLPHLQQLNRQKHCWLLHRLYDDYMVPWELIYRIDNICFDIEVSFQYKMNEFEL